ncbi:OmpA family protein [Acetobacter suratthaniensis]|uniref:OmpA family protein n=1 Tax=Acetobacter suratthaniensis TaxID=1502841 RepID=A0ABS3LJW8_9PROT|nr:flagellar motor protein MotB [Acetobacter suratthaniensis]MBO1327891.1 OmpA family protein [Acetobacter suratthaniensis]MCX2565929.1 OmpA family protein [Acetobacter suratthaniensis]
MARNDKPQVIIKRGDDGGGEGHHGGAWKIAYADFMTAMMSFFLVMWLLNATTDEQRKGIAQFFNPMADRDTHGGPTSEMLDTTPSPLTGGEAVKRIKDGETSEVPKDKQAGAHEYQQTGPKANGAVDITAGIRAQLNSGHPSIVPIGGPQSGAGLQVGYVGGGSPTNAAVAEQANLQNMVQGLAKSMEQQPDLQASVSNMSVRVGRDDIRIELKDSQNRPMFDTGSAAPNQLGRKMLGEIAAWLAPMPEKLSIVGYTDAAAYRPGKKWGMSNWTLSALRADHAREVLVHAGYPDGNIINVSGRADRELAVPSDPSAAGNRRVVLIMHRRYVDPAFDPAAANQSDTVVPAAEAAAAPASAPPEAPAPTPQEAQKPVQPVAATAPAEVPPPVGLQ